MRQELLVHSSVSHIVNELLIQLNWRSKYTVRVHDHLFLAIKNIQTIDLCYQITAVTPTINILVETILLKLKIFLELGLILVQVETIF